MTTSVAKTARMKAVPLAKLGEEYLQLKKPLDAAIHRVLASGSYILGKETEQFEQELAAYCQTQYAVGVSSGTDALQLALHALDIRPGDEVIVPAMTFVATAEAVALLGAKPVFADIEMSDYNLNPADVLKRITPKTKAIIAVHLYGQMADMDALTEISRAKKIPLIEDMAQAIGSEYRNRKAGTFGTMACTSFFPTKNLGACGDGGAILTSDANLSTRLRSLRNHGAKVKYHHDELGYNSRLDEIQAAILRIKLKQLDRWTAKRQALAKEYDRQLRSTPLALPANAPNRKHVYHLYSVRTDQREALRSFLDSRQISTGLHYPIPMHLLQAFKALGGKRGDHPNSEQTASEVMSLPLYPQMTTADIRIVSQAIHDFFRR